MPSAVPVEAQFDSIEDTIKAFSKRLFLAILYFLWLLTIVTIDLF